MKQKTPELGADARAQIKQNLPLAIEKALTSYHQFVDGVGEEPNDFKNHHTAAKAALAHIELLMKLANMVDALDDAQADNILDLLSKAKEELDA